MKRDGYFPFSAVTNLKIVVMALSAILAVTSGVLVYFAIAQYTLMYYRNNFDAITIQIHSSLDIGLSNNYLASQSLSDIMSIHCPNVTYWPNCSMSIRNFIKLVGPLQKIGLFRDMATVPLLHPPHNVNIFEAAAYKFLDENNFYPKGSGRSHFGKGIYAMWGNSSIRYHDTTGETSYSSRKILTPLFEVANIDSLPAVMFNLHSEYHRGRAIDKVMDAWDNGIRNLSAVTPFIQLLQDKTSRPASLMVYPVAPIEQPNELVGFIRIVHNWDMMLAQAVPVNACGIDVVVGDGNHQFTFTLTSSKSVETKGPGDLHDIRYDSYRNSFSTFENPGYSSYVVDFYPNEEFFPDDVEWHPLYGSMAMAVFVILVSCLVWTYFNNNYLQRQLQFKQEALDSKRSFVRFISHEIRTPLNTVCMGLKVLQEEAEKALADSISRPITPTAIQRLSEVASSSQKRRDQIIENACDSYVKSLKESVAGWVALMRDIEESSNNAVNVLNELMSYDKIEMKTLQLEVALLPVWSLVGNSIKPFYIQARERGLHMQLLMEIDSNEDGSFTTEAHRTDLQELHVVGDEVRLAQVFRNLISNALKFSYPGTTVTVQVRYCPEQLRNEGDEFIHSSTISTAINLDSVEVAGSIVVSVTDHGPGLTADNLNKLFREGVQFNANKLQAGGGSGLGLFIAKGIVLLHGGTISATSAGVDQGAVFTVALPVVTVSKKPHTALEVLSAHGDLSDIADKCQFQDAFQDQQRLRNSNSMATSFSNIDSCKSSITTSAEVRPLVVLAEQDKQEVAEKRYVRQVLVVDDAATNRKMLCRLLSNNGCTCHEAADGMECVRRLNSLLLDGVTEVDLILMDFVMIEMNGPQATTELRRLGFKGLIIGVTGNVLQADVNVFMQHGADAVLAKPLMLSKLKDTLKTLHFDQLGDVAL